MWYKDMLPLRVSYPFNIFFSKMIIMEEKYTEVLQGILFLASTSALKITEFTAMLFHSLEEML